MIFLAVAAVAAVITFLTSRVVLRLALRFGIHPPVRDRDVHSRPTPRLGGVAMCLGLLGAFGIAALIPELSGVFAEPVRIWTLLAGAVAICAIGVSPREVPIAVISVCCTCSVSNGSRESPSLASIVIVPPRNR